eukprot:gene17755-19527_t
MDEQIVQENLLFVKKFLSICLLNESLSPNAEEERKLSLLKIDDVLSRFVYSASENASGRDDGYVSKDDLDHYVDMHVTLKSENVGVNNSEEATSEKESKDLKSDNDGEQIYENCSNFNGDKQASLKLGISENAWPRLFGKRMAKGKSRTENVYDSVKHATDTRISAKSDNNKVSSLSSTETTSENVLAAARDIATAAALAQTPSQKLIHKLVKLKTQVP